MRPTKSGLFRTSTTDALNRRSRSTRASPGPTHKNVAECSATSSAVRGALSVTLETAAWNASRLSTNGAAVRTSDTVHQPHELVEEALAAEDPVEQDLAVVALAVVEMDVERPVGGQHAPGLLEPRPDELEVVRVSVVVGHRLGEAPP